MNHLFSEPLCVHKKAWNTCGECRPTLTNTPMQNNTQESWEEKIHKIIQEEIGDRAIYQDRMAEETLRRGLQSTESRLNILVRALLSKQAEEISEAVEGLKTDERKVAVFGEWEARTYDEKQLVNAVLSDTLLAIKQVINK